ncbi:hypothetical protein DET65_1794 [Sunxiuqinia elliptica]|nr:hypothetical protein DET65_1794 [Sunxiuqinia elliptica]
MNRFTKSFPWTKVLDKKSESFKKTHTEEYPHK